MPVYPPTTGGPLNLYVPPFDYGTGVNDYSWDQPINLNWVALNNFASSVVLYAPTTSQTVTQPSATYLNFNFPLIFNGTNPALRFGTSASVWDSALTRTGAGAFSLDSNAVANSAGTLKLAVLNAVTGIQVNGAAPLNHILVGNGTEYVDSATLPAGSANYQEVELNTVALPQRAALNILTPLTAVDNFGNGSTDVGHRTSAATAGTPFTYSTVTVDAYGHVTALAAGTPPSTGVSAVVNNVTGSRNVGVVYQNLSTNAIFVSGNANSIAGSSTCHISLVVGPTASPAMTVWSQENGATVANGSLAFCGFVPPSWYYEIVVAGDAGWNGSSLCYETVLS